MKLGLYVYAGERRDDVAALLRAQEIPFAGFTEEPCMPVGDRDGFLRHAARTLLRPGEPLHGEDILAFLSGDAHPGNVLRHDVNMQLRLTPYLRMHSEIRDFSGGHQVGEDLLAAHLQEDGRVDVELPGGVWTDILTGECFTGRLKLMRPVNRMPILAAAGAVIPIGINDRAADYDPADRVTLHWYQPESEKTIRLHTGETYRLRATESGAEAEADTAKPFHLILHRDGEEQFIR